MDAFKEVDQGLDEGSLEIRLVDEVVPPLEAVLDNDVGGPATPHLIDDEHAVSALEFRPEPLADVVYVGLNELGAFRDGALGKERVQCSLADAVEVVIRGRKC